MHVIIYILKLLINIKLLMLTTSALRDYGYSVYLRVDINFCIV